MEPYFTPTEATMRELAGSTFKRLIASDLTFVDAGGVRWTAPVGTWTDGASVPRLALGVTDGRFESVFLKAAIVHDAYCQKENRTRRPPYQSRSWREVHRMFHEACIAGGTPRVRARLMFAAVWWRGPRWDDDASPAPQAEVARLGFSGTKQWIEKELPSIEEIEADVEKRDGAALSIIRLQSSAIEAMRGRERSAAEARLREAEPLIAAGLERAPDDLMFLNLRGYQHKNWAMAQPETREEELSKAEDSFTKVIAKEPRDASALNGLGSIAILRGDLDEAEEFIRKALRQEPEYPAAWSDLKTVYRLLASRASQ